ncbi:MAG: helix-turn-helix transcriptional regulator [Candidatus Heimdallarchaeota archaeon]|nr:helix-turn-helix transcriptional regulator [Candidatus Heimdallarchaeota archaeon]MCK4876888.1 helix-turn-helix transcriptional regulator [Candidatus Heimdallarchaeota archaeon]
MSEQAKFFKALGDETRLTIVMCLLNKDHCACDFTGVTEREQSTISRHLKVLLEAGVVKFQRKGKNLIYSIKDEEIRKKIETFGIKAITNCCESCTVKVKE